MKPVHLWLKMTCQASTTTGPVRAFMASLDRSAQLLGPRDAVSQCLGETTEKMWGKKPIGGDMCFFFFRGVVKNLPKRLTETPRAWSWCVFGWLKNWIFGFVLFGILKLVDGVILDIQTPKLRFGMTGP